MIPATRATGRLGLLDRELMERMGPLKHPRRGVLPARPRDRDKAIAKTLGELTSRVRNE